jgi:hypothetical protein
VTHGRARVARPLPGNPGAVTDPQETPPQETSPDLEQNDEEVPAFDVDLEPDEQGTAEVADEQTA